MNQWDSEAPPKYVNTTHLSARVGRLNPDWNEDASGARVGAAALSGGAAPFLLLSSSSSKGWRGGAGGRPPPAAKLERLPLARRALPPADAATAERFAAAVELTGREFEEALAYYARSWLPARGHVKEALDQRASVHPSGQRAAQAGRGGEQAVPAGAQRAAACAGG